MRTEYDFQGSRPSPYSKRLGVKGRKAVFDRFLRSEHLVRIDADLAEVFADDATVNATLRLALRMKSVVPGPSAATHKKRRRSG